MKKLRKKLEEFMAVDIPGFEIRSKKTSTLMKLVGKLMFFNKKFMTGYITTFYPYVYVPTLPWRLDSHLPAISVLAHEWVHLHDRKRLGPVFNFLYASPQCLAPFALLAFWNLWFLLFLICLLPLPSPGRAWAEFRGYRMTIAAHYWLSGQKVDLKWIVDQFVGSSYYFMWPFRGWLMKKFQKEFDKIKNDDLSPELRNIKNILTQ